MLSSRSCETEAASSTEARAHGHAFDDDSNDNPSDDDPSNDDATYSGYASGADG